MAEEQIGWIDESHTNWEDCLSSFSRIADWVIAWTSKFTLSDNYEIECVIEFLNSILGFVSQYMDDYVTAWNRK